MMRVGMMTRMGWLDNEEANRDETVEADEMNLEVDSKDEVMHMRAISDFQVEYKKK